MKKFYKPLGMYYRETAGDTITFSDGVVYSRAESNFIAKANLSPDEAGAIHLVKRIFDGEIVFPEKKIKTRQLDALDAIGMKFGRPKLIGQMNNTELQRRIETFIRRRKGVVETVQTNLFKEEPDE